MRKIKLKALPRAPSITHRNLVPLASVYQSVIHKSPELKRIIGSPLISEDLRNPAPVAEDSLCIHLFRHFQTLRVLYSRSRNLNPQEAHEQLTFYGKKTVPGVTRVEIARPPPPGVELDRKQKKRLKKDPIVILEAGTRRDLWQPLATVKFTRPELAEAAFKRLRDLRILRDYAWKQLELPAPKDRGVRKRWMQDQISSSIVDLSTTIDLVNRHIVETRGTILKDWDDMQILAKTAVDGGLDQIDRDIEAAEETVKSEQNSLIEKRTAAEAILDKQAERYKMIKALRVVDLVRRKTQPESLGQALEAEEKEEKRLKKELVARNLRVEILSDQVAEMAAPESENEHLSQVRAERELNDEQERVKQLHDQLSSCKERQKTIFEDLESLAATEHSSDTQSVEDTARTIIAQDPVIPEALQTLVDNVVGLKLHDNLHSLDFDDIYDDYGVTVYWEDPNHRKYAEEWPENTLHKSMGLRPYHLRSVASLPSQIEQATESLKQTAIFQGNEYLDDDIIVLKQGRGRREGNGESKILAAAA